MNVINAGYNLATTSIFENNMSDLKATPDPAPIASASSQFPVIDKIITKNASTCVTSSNLGGSSTSATSSSTYSPSWTLFLSGSLLSSSSSSLIPFESPSSVTWLSDSTSYENNALVETNDRDSRRLTLPTSTVVSSSSGSRSRGSVSGINGAGVSAARGPKGRYANRYKGLVRPSTASSSTTSSSISTSTRSSGILYGEESQREYEKERNREKTISSQSWEEDEGFASGDENGDDSESENDNSTINPSTSRNIEDASTESDDVENNPDTRLLDSTVDGDNESLFGFAETMEELEAMTFNETFYNDNASLYDSNSSSYGNESSIIVIGDGMYPSGYSLLQIILASIAATVLMIIVIVGNMLVIIAIATEKALKNIQNWFIASLAVADFFLGLIIMPFSLANEIMGYWIFGYWWCDIYSAMDVLLCTASIMNLCLISLDRFWSITQAIEYLKKRTPARAALMITMVWLLSALVCIPPLLGWKRPAPAEEYPKCSLSEDIGYVLYSALGSFYIPSCIMVFVYIRIYFAAKARARRGIRKQPRPRPAMPTESPDIRQTSFTQSTPATDSRRTPGTMDNVATIENQPVQIPIVTCDFASDVSTSEADPGGGSLALEEKDTLKVSMPIPLQKTNLKASLSVNGSSEGATSHSSLPARCRAPSVGIDVDMVSEFDPSSSDSGVVSRCAVVKPLKLRICRPIFGRKAIGKLKREHGDPGKHSGKDVQEETKPPKPRDPEREKRRLARKKEKRATLILGLIMGSFIACWLPFFFLYIIKPLFPNLNIPVQAFAIAFWLGYINSALNPVIYTVFNKDFRRAFRRILYK